MTDDRTYSDLPATCGEWVHPEPTERCALPRRHGGLHEPAEPISLDDLRLSRRESEQLAVTNLLHAHYPRHDSSRRGDAGPITGCTCGALRLGDSWGWHVADQMLSLLRGDL